MSQRRCRRFYLLLSTGALLSFSNAKLDSLHTHVQLSDARRVVPIQISELPSDKAYGFEVVRRNGRVDWLCVPGKRDEATAALFRTWLTTLQACTEVQGSGATKSLRVLQHAISNKQFARSPRLWQAIRSGVPENLRPLLWRGLCGVEAAGVANPLTYYRSLHRRGAGVATPALIAMRRDLEAVRPFVQQALPTDDTGGIEWGAPSHSNLWEAPGDADGNVSGGGSGGESSPAPDDPFRTPTRARNHDTTAADGGPRSAAATPSLLFSGKAGAVQRLLTAVLNRNRGIMYHRCLRYGRLQGWVSWLSPSLLLLCVLA